ncbi:MAG: GMP synthase [Ferruginibacter sp.]
MNLTEKQHIRIAILDLYDGKENQGMRCLREIVDQFGINSNINITLDIFDIRLKKEIPSINYDVFLSSGGPGSPLESEGSDWEEIYFNWLQQIEHWNNDPFNHIKKYVFFICHSFQLVSRHYGIGNVCKRKSTAFGVFPVHLLHAGENEVVFNGLHDPFYAVDSRDYQFIEPNKKVLHEMGASILAIEKERPHVTYERAVMAVRFNEYMIGTQFHPEADAIGMSMHLQTEDKKKMVIENYGHEKWQSMIHQLNDPEKIMWTYSHILPNFLNIAVSSLIAVEA